MKISLIHRPKYKETESNDFLRILSVFIAMTFKNCFSGESLLWKISLHPNMLQVLHILSTGRTAFIFCPLKSDMATRFVLVKRKGCSHFQGTCQKPGLDFPPPLLSTGMVTEAEAKLELHQPGFLSTKTSPCPLVMDLSSDLEIYFFVKPLRFEVVPAAKSSPSY